MRKLLKNCKGAVTVMVSLLLIPAILITGTGVDLARIYAAHSTLQDANQLAANSVLASYDALLQDLYGLFAIMQDDVDFETMTDEYIKLAVEGEDWIDDGMGSFQLFYGSNLTPGDVVPAANQNLANLNVLRRQIEEYSKFRAPIIIVNEILDKMDTFQRVQEDAKVIKKKMEVDDQIEEVDKWYRKIYQCINNLNICKTVEETAMRDVSNAVVDIQSLFSDMSDINFEYAKTSSKLKDAEEAYEDAQRDYETAEAKKEMEEREEEIEKLEDERSQLESQYKRTISEIIERSDKWADDCEQYEDLLDGYISDSKDSLSELLELCAQAERAKADLEEKIEELEAQINSGKCSDTLRDGLTQPPQDENDQTMKDASGNDMKSVIDQYKDLLAYDLNQMAEAMNKVDEPQIKDTITLMKDAALGGYKLTDLQNMSVEQLLTAFPLQEDDENWVNYFTGILSAATTFSPASPGFKEFDDAVFSATKNDTFYKELDTLYGEGKGDEQGKSNVKDSVKKIFQKVKEVFTEGLAFDPEGAKKLENAEDDSDPSTGSDFGTNDDYDWSNDDGGKDELEDSLDSDFLSILANTANAAGNKLLLLTYDTEMFSDYSTTGTKGEDEGKELETNMAGIPLSTDVNYYFQSELEYLYNGNLSDAIANLESVAGMIFLIRFVFDYVASFSITSVNTLVNTIKTTLAWSGPFAILTAELARLGIALGESALDVSRLRSGDNVAVYKSNSTWKFSVEGLAEMFKDVVSDAALEAAFDTSGGDDTSDSNTVTLSYKDYLRLFLLLVPSEKLAERTANLIELNVTNKKYDINADEEKMASATRVDLSRAITDFQLTTTVDMRMLFLSMPFAQKGVNGVIPPKTLPISVTDYRGY